MSSFTDFCDVSDGVGIVVGGRLIITGVDLILFVETGDGARIGCGTKRGRDGVAVVVAFDGDVFTTTACWTIGVDCCFVGARLAGGVFWVIDTDAARLTPFTVNVTTLRLGNALFDG